MYFSSMKLKDFRKIGKGAQGEVRRRAIVMLRDLKLSQSETARALGVSRQTVNTWAKRHDALGEQGLEDHRRNRHRRGAGILTMADAQKIQDWVRDKCPDQLKLPFALWTAQAVRELIRRRLGKELGLSTMHLYLSKWGYTPQKPLTRATQRCPARIQAWLEQEYPAIAARSRREKAAIWWGDETGLSNQDQVGRSWAPQGKTPVVRRTAVKVSTSIIVAVNNRGLMRFRTYAGALNASLFLDFLKRLIRSSSGKVFLIVDNLRVHHAKVVRQWLDRPQSRKRIELFYLPAYAPECNPEEYLNNDLKQQIKNKPRPSTKDGLVATTISVMRSIQRRPKRVRSYFRAKDVRYAA